MNLLELAQALARESGGNPAALTTTVNQTGKNSRLVEWVKQSWLEIALLHPEWKWLRRTVSFATVTGQRAYLPGGAEIALTNFGAWRPGELVWRRYITGNAGSENYLEWQSYDQFRAYWLFGSRRTEQSQPLSIAVRPEDDALVIGPLPDATGWTVEGEYYATPTELSADADIPAMPLRYHMLIVYKAMQKSGAYDAATEVLGRGETEYARMLSELESNQLEPITMAGSLV